MREILFRGKRLDNGDWCYGYYVSLADFNGNERHRIYERKSESELDGEGRIFYPDYFDVDTATIGQFTGLVDMHKNMIFEGDIVKYGSSIHEVVFETRNQSGYFGIRIGCETWQFQGSVPACLMEVIGNIYDNKELCKKQ